ncbi:precorrin-6A reductase [Vagococcus hydrophili]|uniref:Precorrin-6A reductase n=1 Tax=Vagococcus hydrophili TaxID=2714947 RepID=A0A6G8AUI2_9ENTE|nr:precorrin-6A reductase [Vagococcus hydrophili]QIL48647.1 precorrin-6A reductase [Vagococcus hydrophili]
MILVLGGTSDSLTIAESLEKKGYDVCFSVVTDYGEQLAEKKINKINKGRMDQAQMEQFVLDHKVFLILDGTHPFAAIVSKTAIAAAKSVGVDYIRYERPRVDLKEAVKVRSNLEACEWVKAHVTGTIYLTTGSKTLGFFGDNLPFEKIVARVLPTAEVLTQTEHLGFQAHQIEGIKGPFSVEMNKQLLMKNKAEVMITKESGIAGGILEKMEACQLLGIPCVVIAREDIPYPRMYNDTTKLYEDLEEYK